MGIGLKPIALVLAILSKRLFLAGRMLAISKLEPLGTLELRGCVVIGNCTVSGAGRAKASMLFDLSSLGGGRARDPLGD